MKPNQDFIVEDMTLEDDGFHKSKRLYGEWWYFDAVFDNGYSINAFIGVISRGKYGLVLPILHVYKDKKRIFNRRELRCFNEFSPSEKMPYVQLSKKDFINGRIDEKTGDIIYDVSLEVGDQKINLQFTGDMKGWMGKIPAGKWGVMLPRAKVKGTLTINGQLINVKGVGYHDHNWDFRLTTTSKGWYWGRFGGELLNIVWSRIMQSKSKDFILAVLNEGKTNYINIKPEKIHFLITDYTYDHGRKIPKDFVLKIKDEHIDVDIRMETTGVFRHIKMFLVNYWRYHVHVIGHISYQKHTEKIDKDEIIEFLKIR